ncbi:MAG: CAP domain-containing protein [Bacteroidota bacterium]
MRSSALTVLILLLLTSCLPQGQYNVGTSTPQPSTPTPPSSTSGSSENNDFQSSVLAAVNQLRAQGCRCGSTNYPSTTPLSWNNQLQIAAERHAKDIQKRGKLNHKGSDGSTIASRVKATGYDWKNVAENLALGDFNTRTVIDAWKRSPGHCKNMMDGVYKEVAVHQLGNYWVMVLGTSF